MRSFSLAPVLLGLAFALTVSSPVAHADTISDFSISGAGVFGSIPIHGTIQIDTTTGTILSYAAVAGGLSDAGVSLQGYADGLTFFHSTKGSITINAVSLVNYAGSGFSASLPDDAYQGTISLVSSTTTPSVTPEPSTLLLLGTGLLGIAGRLRQRFD